MKFSRKVLNLNLKSTLISGQVFRWQCSNNTYEGVIKDSYVRLKLNDSKLDAEILSGSLLWEDLEYYLAIDEPYKKILSDVEQDVYVREGVKIYEGYRILRQDPYETLLSFIVSTNSNVAKIRGSLEKLAKFFGEEVYQDKFALPATSVLAGLTETQVMKSGVGYRAKYLINTARYIEDNGWRELQDIQGLDDQSANKLLQNYCGVGPKVADCILLFAFNRLNRVPLDVWVQRILCNLYGYKSTFKYEEMQSFAQETLGIYAGYASQFLYEAVRTGKIKLKT